VLAETTILGEAPEAVRQIRGKAAPAVTNPGIDREDAKRCAKTSLADLTVMSRRLMVPLEVHGGWGSIREEPPRGDPWKHAGSTADFGQCRFRMANASRRADERETNTALKSA